VAIKRIALQLYSNRFGYAIIRGGFLLERIIAMKQITLRQQMATIVIKSGSQNYQKALVTQPMAEAIIMLLASKLLTLILLTIRQIIIHYQTWPSRWGALRVNLRLQILRGFGALIFDDLGGAVL